VFEPDNVTPHPNARVFVGRFNDDTGKFENVVAAVTADNDGFWIATNFPAGIYDVAAISFDGKRKGDRRKIQASLATDTQVSITLNGRTTVAGRVEFFNGLPATNALVAGGGVVRTDANGRFTLTGVPTGQHHQRGVERNTVPPANCFTRLGSGANASPAWQFFVVVRLRAAGALGAAPRRAAVQHPRGYPGARRFPVDGRRRGSNYVFENLGLADIR
jgi:hypothetical protein